MVVEYLQALVIILGISAIIVFVLGKLRISSVVGFLLAGVLIGPSGLNLIRQVHSRMPSSAMRLMADDVLLFIGKRRDIDCAMEFLDSRPDKPVQCPVREDEPDL